MKHFKNILIWLGAILIGFSILKISLAQIKLESSTQDKFLIKTSDYSETLILKNNKILASQKPTEKLSRNNKTTIESNIGKILSKAPLNDDAILQFFIAENLPNSDPSKLELLLMIKARNARNRAALRHLLLYYNETANIEKFGNELDLLIRLNPRKNEFYYQTLNALYEVLSGRDLINEALKKKSIWGQQFLSQQIANASSDQILELAKPIKSHILAYNDEQKTRALAEGFIRKLVNSGHITKAYDFWLSYFPNQDSSVSDSTNRIFNPAFQDIVSLSPFNWRVLLDGDNYFEYGSDGLFVSINIQNPKIILHQYIPMDGVEHKFVIDTQAKFRGNSKIYEWRGLCLNDNEKPVSLIFETALRDEEGEDINKFYFTAQNCSFVDLQLWGRPSRVKKRSGLTIQKVELLSVN